MVYDSLVPYPITEHLIVQANPWIADTLAETDYYRQMALGRFIFEQRDQVVLCKDDTIGIPSPERADTLIDWQNRITIDLNIPEFKLRILRDADTLYTFPVRVGRNEQKYLEMSGRVTDLRTARGVGKIVRIEKDPDYIDPCNCKPYEVTRRDDGRVTRCPRIPWLEPEINNRRPGHLIHPTTNPRTVGRAYSNGCVGTKEADAWRIYYHAPIGTKVVFRYDLSIRNEAGDTVVLRDIYKLRKAGKK